MLDVKNYIETCGYDLQLTEHQCNCTLLRSSALHFRPVGLLLTELCLLDEISCPSITFVSTSKLLFNSMSLSIADSSTSSMPTDKNIQTKLLLLQPFNGLFSRTTWVSRYQKGKTNQDFTGARDSEWQWHQPGHMQVCTSLQTDNHANTPPLVSYRPDALPAAQPTASKHWRHNIQTKIKIKLQ